MPRKGVVIKTYGRHKYRTIKSGPWLSPDDDFVSPVSKKDRKSIVSKPTTCASKCWTKPVAASSKADRGPTGWNAIPKRLPSTYGRGKENNSTDSFDYTPPPLQKKRSWKLSNHSTPLEDKDVNVLERSTKSRSSWSTSGSFNKSRQKSCLVDESEMSEDISLQVSSRHTSVNYLSSFSDDSVTSENLAGTRISRNSKCSSGKDLNIVPESPENEDFIGKSKENSSLPLSNNSNASYKSFENKPLRAFGRDKDDNFTVSPVLLYPQLQLNDISASSDSEPHATSTPVIRANSRNTQLVTSRGRRRATAAKPPKKSGSFSDCQVVVEHLKLTPIQYEAARRLSENGSNNLRSNSDSSLASLKDSQLSANSVNDSSCSKRHSVGGFPDSVGPQTSTETSGYKSSSYCMIAGCSSRQSTESIPCQSVVINNSSSSHIGGPSTSVTSTGNGINSDISSDLLELNLSKNASSSRRRSSVDSTTSYAGSLMDCVVSLERLQLTPRTEDNVKGRIHRSSVDSDTASDTSVMSVPPKTPARKHASHMSFLEALTPASEIKKASEIEEEVQVQNLDPYQKLLLECEQEKPLTFKEYLKPSCLKKCKKIGEGVYGEVFKTINAYRQPVAIKIIPINGDFPVNGEPQKSYEEMMPEIVISKELSSLNHDDEEEFAENSTSNFIEVYSVRLIQDKYPEPLLKEWDKWDGQHQSENDRPDIFPSDQLFIVFEFANGGSDLEHFQFKSMVEAFSVLQQTALSLAVAESALEFEHRDLHWGNVLIARGVDCEQPLIYWINGERFMIDSQGVRVSLIDFTLSRLKKDGLTVFCDLSEDESMFTGRGDYQFDVYRKMRKQNGDDWEKFNPFSNVLWLHYLADKILKNKSYPEKDRSLDARLRKSLRQIQRCESALAIVYEGLFDSE